MDELLERTKDLKGQDRFIQWKEAVAIAKNGEILFSLEVEGNHGILQTEYDKTKYKPGIWTCSLWSYPQFGGKNFFDLNEEESQESEISWDRIKAGVERFWGSTGKKLLQKPFNQTVTLALILRLIFFSFGDTFGTKSSIPKILGFEIYCLSR